jgi:hypothetical protein
LRRVANLDKSVCTASAVVRATSSVCDLGRNAGSDMIDLNDNPD